MDATTAPAPAPTDVINGRTVADWEAEAAAKTTGARASHQSAHDSYDRCDTDGWASQAASTLTGRLREAEAERARNYGYVTVNVLTDLTGRIISTRQRYGQYGAYWIVDDQAQAELGLTKPFVSLSKARDWRKAEKANARKGVRLARARVFGHVKMAAPEGAKGFAGMAQCYVDTFADSNALLTGSAEVTVPCLLTVLAQEDDERAAHHAAMAAERAAAGDTQF